MPISRPADWPTVLALAGDAPGEALCRASRSSRPDAPRPECSIAVLDLQDHQLRRDRGGSGFGDVDAAAKSAVARVRKTGHHAIRVDLARPVGSRDDWIELRLHLGRPIRASFDRPTADCN